MEVSYLTDGFSSITIGRMSDGTGTVTINPITFNDPLTIAGGSVAFSRLSSRDFDGVDDYIDAGNSGTFDITSQLSLVAWIKPDVVNQNFGILSKWTTSTGSSNSYLLYGGQDVFNDKLRFFIQQSNGAFSSISPTTSLTAGTWVHLAAVADGAVLRLYVNGVDTGTTAAYDGTIAVSAKNLLLGKLREEDGLYAYDGYHCVCEVFDRGLSAAEVLQLRARAGFHEKRTSRLLASGRGIARN